MEKETYYKTFDDGVVKVVEDLGPVVVAEFVKYPLPFVIGRQQVFVVDHELTKLTEEEINNMKG